MKVLQCFAYSHFLQFLDSQTTSLSLLPVTSLLSTTFDHLEFGVRSVTISARVTRTITALPIEVLQCLALTSSAHISLNRPEYGTCSLGFGVSMVD